MAKILASWINGRIDAYNSQLGLSLPHANVGSKVTAAFINNILSQVTSACAAQNRSCALPPFVGVGQQITLLQLPDTVTNVVPGMMSWTSGAANIWKAPAGITKVMVNWAIGGGGAGGVGTEYGYGGGGGGGGSGGSKQYYEIACNPGDTFTISIGSGAAVTTNIGQNVNVNGASGGDTTVKLNGVTVIVTKGGQGGIGSQNYSQGQIGANGGLGGTFNGSSSGLSGQSGQIGANDRSSSYGGGGAPGPIQGALGGAGGKANGGASPTGATAGCDGVGYGSGGGGGGSADRSGGHFWAGGAGQGGYVEFAWPSAGATGGTPAANNSGYSAGALSSPTAIGGGYTGGSGYGGSNASGISAS